MQFERKLPRMFSNPGKENDMGVKIRINKSQVNLNEILIAYN